MATRREALLSDGPPCIDPGKNQQPERTGDSGHDRHEDRSEARAGRRRPHFQARSQARHGPRQDRPAFEEPLQVVGQGRGRRIAAIRLLRQAFQADRLEIARDARPQATRATGSSATTCRNVSRLVLPRNGGRPASSS